MYNLHQEHHFEFAICEHLGQNGCLYAEGDAAGVVATTLRDPINLGCQVGNFVRVTSRSFWSSAFGTVAVG